MKRHILPAALLLVSSFALAGDDQAAIRAPDPATDPEIPFEKYTLDNGLEVILHQDNTVPLVAISVWFHVGSGHETPGKSGFAHLFEHMLFQGSQHVGADKHFDMLKQIGGDSINGTTNPDRTNYFEVVPSNQLEAALWIESDRMGYMLPMLTKDSLANQIDVVRNERRQRYDNVAYRLSGLRLSELLYPDGHPYRYQTIGRHEDLTSATLDDVIGFYKTWYVPANATLAIAGDFDTAEAKAMIQKWFGSFPASTKPAVVQIAPPAAKAQREEMTDAFAKLRQVTFSWHSAGNFAAGDAELDLAAQVLGGGDASRLYKVLVVDKQLAQSVSASQYGMTFSGQFSITVQLRGEADLAVVEQIVQDEVDRVRRDPVSQRERDRAVTLFEASSVWGLESLLARVETLQSFNHYLGDPGKLTWSLDRYRNATVDGIRDAAAKYLGADKMTEVVTLPQGVQP